MTRRKRKKRLNLGGIVNVPKDSMLPKPNFVKDVLQNDSDIVQTESCLIVCITKPLRQSAHCTFVVQNEVIISVAGRTSSAVYLGIQFGNTWTLTWSR
jgi:hypothetical protein